MTRYLAAVGGGIVAHFLLPVLIGQPNRSDPNDWRWMATDVGAVLIGLLIAGYFYLGGGPEDENP